MIHGWRLFGHVLWIAGLALAVAVLGVANYQARGRSLRLGRELARANRKGLLGLGLAAFCLGRLLAGQAGWARIIWGVLSILSVAYVGWTWRRGWSRIFPLAMGQRQARHLGRALVLAGGVILLVGLGLPAVQTARYARSLRDHAAALEALAPADGPGPGLGDAERAGRLLAGLRRDLEGLRAYAGPFLPFGRLLGWLPRHGGDLAAAGDLLDVGLDAVTAGDTAFQALSPTLQAVNGAAARGDAALGERLLPLLVAAGPQLQEAQAALDATHQARARLDDQALSPGVAGLLARLDRYLPLLQDVVDAGLLAPKLLGADGPRTYLVLAQNNHELRPTGGFISGAGELHVEGGRIVSLHFDDSYAVDNLKVPHPVAPADFRQVLLGDIFFFRDTNWDADFPTSARRAIEVYARDRGVQADGVIALDLAALASLLRALGPVRVQGIPQPVTGDNVLRVLQDQWAAPTAGPRLGGDGDADWWLHRKDFMGQVADAALDRLLSGEDVQPGSLGSALIEALDEKHILLYLDDPEAARLLREREWDGALPDPAAVSDLLLVVDSNVGFNKVDARVTRAIDYRVELDAGGGPRARLALTYHNHGQRPVSNCVQEARYGDTYADMMDRCYWNYVRVYVPPGSRWLAGPAIPLPPGSLLARATDLPAQPPPDPIVQRGGWTVWTAFFALAPGEERTLTFEYQLPGELLQLDAKNLGRYRLRVLKQPGTEAVPLHIEFTLPPGSELVGGRPVELLSPRGTVIVESDLRIDREFEIVFEDRKASP